jgi:hypothetical protein
MTARKEAQSTILAASRQVQAAIACNSDSGKRVTVAADADPTRAAKTLFNPFRVDIVCDSAFPGFAPRAVLFHPYGVASHMLLLWIEHNHIPHGSPRSGFDDPERVE